ncbi:MAG: DUF3320 domain-containing protein, partial [Methylococcaceae bacterium]
SKARKLDVLAQLQKAWEAQGAIDQEVWRTEAARLKKRRDELNVYVERLHRRHGNGMTLFEAIGGVVGGKDMPVLALSWGTAHAHGKADMDAMREVVDRLDVNVQAVGQTVLPNHPLAAITHGDWSPSWQQGVIDSARGVVPAAQAVRQAGERFIQEIGLPDCTLDRRARGALAALARILPSVAGRDWRFVLRADARAIAERLQEGMALLAQQRALSAALSPQWPDTVISAGRRGLQLLQQRRETFSQLGQPWMSEVVETLRQGSALLDELHRTTQQLSVQYAAEIEQINVHQLHRQWSKAEKAIWPLSWFGKRKIRRRLDGLVIGTSDADVERDILLLARIRELRSEISAIEVSPAIDGVWAGLKTKTEFVQCALNFQQALDAARREQPWQTAGFEPIAEGRCGERLAQELAKLRTLSALETELNALQHSGPASAGLWAGLDTHIAHWEDALRFVTALRDVREAGTLPGEHDAVAGGACGVALAEDYQCLCRRADIERQLADYDDLREITAGLWNGLKTRTEQVDQALKFQTSIAAIIAGLANTAEQISVVKAPLELLIGSGNALLEPGGTLAEAGAAYLQTWGTLQPAIDRLTAAGSFSDAAKTEFGGLPLDILIGRCTEIIRAENHLHAWCAWRKVCEQARTLGLAPLVESLENACVAQGSVRRVFGTNYSRWWLNAVVDEEPVIRAFVAAEHEQRIDDFRALDDRFTKLTCACIRAGLCAELPTQDSVARNSEWGTLRREMSKKKRHMPLRALMTSIPTVLPKLTPCLLMSPLSIAQYLAADATAFDVVVFDEASQIPVWDAVGAIARGKQVVMVGDPKQLPPTSFFDRAESDLDDEDVEGDLESILDECLGANLPTLHLAWHYRSRHESLIAFSNHRYYDGALVTFPSPVTEDRAVSFHYVPGVYEKGGTRTNQPEAHALVADLVGRLKSPEFRASGLSIGVVTFNTEQQALIEDLLDAARRQDPSIEPCFAEVELEPVFVKNLESVQGDERDLMYFSITYGPDQHGAVSMNFGPLNRDGGERRLNVAITRARHELRVFSSLKPEQMDLARTQARGVRDLKQFLEFAERGPRALAEATGGNCGHFDSRFAQAVAAALTGLGWELHAQVGASAFRVDLAVVHPDAAGAYLAGIECDGATYHRSATARDRDKLRQQVLHGLGWDIQRVWSTDWWINAAGALAKLDAKLRLLLETSRSRRAEQEAARLVAEAALVQAREDAAAAASCTGGAAAIAAESGDEHENSVRAVESAANSAQVIGFSEIAGTSFDVFVEADPTTAVDGVDPAAFYAVAYDPVLERMIAHVIEIEGPVLDAVLARRIARAHGWQRTGSRIQERVDTLAGQVYRTTQEDVGTFYWPAERGPEAPLVFRRAQDESARTVDEICMAELTALVRVVLADGKSGEDAMVAMARELGLRRFGAASRGRVERAVGVVGVQYDC